MPKLLPLVSCWHIVKFGRKIMTNLHDEWRPFRIDYNLLKRELKSRTTSHSWDDKDEPDAVQTTELSCCIRDAEKDVQKLVAQESSPPSSKALHTHSSDPGLHRACPSDYGPDEGSDDDDDDMDDNQSDTSIKDLFHSLQEEVATLVADVHDLALYTKLNITGFLKISKKHDMRFLEEIKKPPPPEKKLFIFLDVTILRKYLEYELNVNNTPFPFDLEMAIDAWVLLIFFVGNDFLPHLPSLEIHEGAIDTLLRIWKMELPRMGGYLMNHGQLVLSRAQIILEGLARREDEIFQTYHISAEQCQDQEAKHRRIEKSGSGENAAGNIQFAIPSVKLGLTASTTSLSSLPQRADNAFAAKADSIGLGAPRNAQSLEVAPVAAQALAGSNRDVVANRAAIQMANMSAAEMLKAELSGLIPVKQSISAPKPEPVVPTPPPKTEAELMDDGDIPGLGNASSALEFVDDGAGDMDVEPNDPVTLPADEPVTPVAGVKWKLEDIEGEDTDKVAGIDEESSEDNEDASYTLVVRADGSVDQADNMRIGDNWQRTDIGINHLFDQVLVADKELFKCISLIEQFRNMLTFIMVKVWGFGSQTSDSVWIRSSQVGNRSGPVEAAPKFSKFIHGCATLLPNHIDLVPFWLPQMDTDILKPNTGYLTVERPTKSTPDFQSGILSPLSPVLPVHSYIEPVSEGEEDEEMDLTPARDEFRHTGLAHEDVTAAIAFREKSLKEREPASQSRGSSSTPEVVYDERMPLLKLPQPPRAERNVSIDPLAPSSAFDEHLHERLQVNKNVPPHVQDGEVQAAVGLDEENLREEDRLLVRDWCAPSGKRIAVLVHIEFCKRTHVLEWLSFVVLIGTIATMLLNFVPADDPQGLISAALLAITYSAIIFVYRALRLHAQSVEGLYYDKYGPTILCFLLLAVTSNL
ncbi:uncharacterized protein F5147DRAFT_785413 [Suillus discolor]|uniref:SPX domain-containing protein n=1 Tax=Suillus discolor TaxID=1912936 RepID=A0A9P7K0U2_9AGAM|nr:uncharacterized protein F5147DRAFT_785413 [Suillus discolor]KAG2120559.1 hypothetical protein F5147DRAFT_785413 [Suillus discolor]